MWQIVMASTYREAETPPQDIRTKVEKATGDRQVPPVGVNADPAIGVEPRYQERVIRQGDAA
jgi:hypothetical protein